jgi:phosphatidylinositol glycan class B
LGARPASPPPPRPRAEPSLTGRALAPPPPARSYGHLTWEWAAGLRGYAHPGVFAALFWLLRAARLDFAWAVAKAPQLLQAAFAAATDAQVHRLAAVAFGRDAARWALACQALSWFNAYCLPRTYSSSLEALLTALGARLLLELPFTRLASANAPPGSHWLWRAAAEARWVAAAAACVAPSPGARRRLLAAGALLGGGALAAGAALDRLAYGRWVFAPWEFARFNLFAGGSAIYGSHPWHWNFLSGFPAMLASLLPLVAAGLWRLPPSQRPLAYLVALQLAVYSLPAHKEFRFLLPALQLATPLAGLGAQRLWWPPSRGASRQGAAQRRLIAVCLALQLPLLAYFLLLHGRGQVAVMELVRGWAARQPSAADASVLFLTPCHATPYYAHVHRPLPLRFLDCSPPGWAPAVAALNADAAAWLRLPDPCPLAAPGEALTERACFERAPADYLERVLRLNARRHPALVVGYAPAMAELAGVLGRHGYARRAALRNCLVQTDGDAACSIEAWERGA